MYQNAEILTGAAALPGPDLIDLVTSLFDNDGAGLAEGLVPAIDNAVDTVVATVGTVLNTVTATTGSVFGTAADAGVVGDVDAAVAQAPSDVDEVGQAAVTGGTGLADVVANLPGGLGIVAADAVSDVETQVNFTVNALLGQGDLLGGGILGEGILGEGMGLPNLDMLPVLGEGSLDDLLGTAAFAGNVADVDGLFGEDVALQFAPVLGEDALLDLDEDLLGTGSLLGLDGLLGTDGLVDLDDLLG